MRVTDPELGYARASGHLQSACDIASGRLQILLNVYDVPANIRGELEDLNTLLQAALAFAESVIPRLEDK